MQRLEPATACTECGAKLTADEQHYFGYTCNSCEARMSAALESEPPEPVAAVRQRTVGISIDLWFFPELDQWKLSLSRNCYSAPILAIGPFRVKWKPVKILRPS